MPTTTDQVHTHILPWVGPWPSYLQSRYNTNLRTDSDMFRTRRHTSLFRKKSTEPKSFYLPISQLIFLLLHKSLKNFHPQCTIAIKQRHRSRRQLKVMMIRMISMMIPMLTHRLLKAGEVRNRALKDPPVLSSATPVSVGYTFISQVFKYKLTSKVYPLGVS